MSSPFSPGVHPANILKLKQQLRSGLSTLILSQDSMVERVTSNAVVQLHSLDAPLLVDLGKWPRDGEIQASCRLPACVVREAETPADSIFRLFEEVLKPWSRSVVLADNAREKTDELAKSQRFDVRTRY